MTQYDAVVGYATADCDVFLKHTSDSKVKGVKP
jgi:hypothetical protein